MLSTLNLLKFTCRIGNTLPKSGSKSSLNHGLLLSKVSQCSSIGKTFSTCKNGLLKKTQRIGRISTQVEELTWSFKSLYKPFMFTISVGCVSYAAAAIWQYEDLKKKARKNIYVWSKRVNEINSFQDLKLAWKRVDRGEKILVSIIALNSAVFLLWRIPALSNFMITYFTGNPVGAAPCISMVCSAFSHVSLFHIVANMYVLNSFAPSVTRLLGPEQFAATYLTAAAVSSFGSYVYKVIVRSKVPSLGASGAIFAVLGMVCTKYPESRLSIAFVDRIIPHSFSAGTAMMCVILLDTAGLLLRWKMFDHAAHLSGLLFGIWYVSYGHKWIWRNRDRVVKRWQSIRGKYPGE